jgi:hypothetical protein
MIEKMLKFPLSRKIKLIIYPINLINPIFRTMVFDSYRIGKGKNVSEFFESTRRCIDKGIKWILVHQGLQPDGGITSFVNFSKGDTIIGTSYPEVTGYIIPTLFNYAHTFNNKESFTAAIRASDFELSLQHAEGYFPGGIVGHLTGPSVFNSAQIVHGLVKTYEMTGNSKYIDSAVKACHWICKVQEEDGAWGKYNYLGLKRVYDTKVCQALLETSKATGLKDFLVSVNRNLDFAVSRQRDNGWFADCDNSHERNEAPLTHTIGYTIQGLLACYSMIKREDLLSTASKTLKVLLHKFELDRKPLSGRFFSDWKEAISSTCITGDAQISLCWMELYKILGDYRYLNAAFKMNDFLKKIQYDCKYNEIDGALPSSFPPWGDYLTFCVNSWGVKYFVDALIEEYQIKRDLNRL